jgi:hypothetical protein
MWKIKRSTRKSAFNPIQIFSEPMNQPTWWPFSEEDAQLPFTTILISCVATLVVHVKSYIPIHS